MTHVFLYSLVLLFIGIVAFGIYITVIAYDKNLQNRPECVTDNLKTFKWLGPTIVGVGLMFLSWTSYSLYSGSEPVTSHFGFKFY